MRKLSTVLIVLALLGTLWWSADSWFFVIKHWHVTVPVLVLLALRIYGHHRQDARVLERTKIEVLYHLKQADLYELELIRLIDEPEYLDRLDRALLELTQNGHIECVDALYPRYRFC